MSAITGVDSPPYSSCLYHLSAITGSAVSRLTALLKLPLPPYRPSLDQHQWTRRSTQAACRPSLDQLSVDSLLYSSCLYHHVSHHWISISGLTDYHVNHYWVSISGLTTLLELPLPPVGLSADSPLLELPLPPCQPSLDQCQRTHRSTRTASTTMSAITGSVSADSTLY